MTTESNRRKKIEFHVSPRYIFKPFAKPDIIFDSTENKELQKSDIETSILIYEDRVKSYFFDQTRKLLNSSNLDNEPSIGFSAYTVLMIAISQIEGMQQYREGESSDADREKGIRSRSRSFFVKGMTRIFSLGIENEEHLKELYSTVRCGLFHDGFTKGLVYLTLDFNNPEDQEALKIEPWEYNPRKIRFEINPKSFLAEVENDFDKYISNLRDSKPEFDDLRNKFTRLWKDVWDRAKELDSFTKSNQKDMQI